MKSILVLLLFCLAFLPVTGQAANNEDAGSNLPANRLHQDISVRGSIVSAEDGGGLPGVNVIVKGTSRATITDTDGNFEISVPSAESMLVFSLVGFKSKEILVGNRSQVTITMEPDIAALDEVIVVGYGSQEKASIVGAISNVDIDEMKKAAPSNLTSAIAGRVTGALVRLGDGNIGGGDDRYSTGVLDDAQIFIRGRATTNSAQPLILVDGVESSFSRINPEDIAQFSVLKDASATAVYGVRGANGVILITTKSGTVGKPRVTLNTQLRMQQPLNFPRPLGAYDYAVLFNEALRNAGQDPLYTDTDLEHWRTGDSPYTHPDVNWYNELVKDHFWEQQHDVNINGGTETVKYYISGEYDHAGGPFKAGEDLESTYDRYNLRTNFDFNITESTELSVKLNGRYEKKGDVNHGEPTGRRYYGSFWYDILGRLGNISPVYNPNGTFAFGENASWNAMADLKAGGYRTRLTNTAEANFNLRQKLDFVTPGLSFRTMFGLIYGSGTRKKMGGERDPALWDYNATTDEYTLRRAEAVRGYSIDRLGYARRTHIEFALNYDKTIARDHRITAMGIYIQTSDESDAVLPVSYRGLAGRLTYAYKSKYLAEVNVGYNGSDQFSKENRYALLPAGSLGWVISEENFMKDNVGFIDFLKIRGSYGTAANDQIGSYRYLYRYEFQNTDRRWTDYSHEVYNFGITPESQTGIREGTLGNEDVTWEIARKANIGIDLEAVRSRLSLTVDVFQEKRDNILVIRQDVPTQTGLNSDKLPAQNLGKVTNKGFELALSYRQPVGDFSFTVGGTYTFARSNIDYIAEAQKEYDYQMRANKPIGQPFGYVWTGEFYDYDDLENPGIAKPEGTLYAGDLIFEDLNDDGVINDYDITAIGYPSIPEEIFGLNLDFSYKNVYISTFWQGASNISSRYGRELRYEFAPNILPFHKDRWVYDPERGLDTRETATYPSLIIGGSTQTTANSTFQLQNSEYLRLKAAEIGYNFPEHIVKKVRMSDLRVFISGSNLWTLSHIEYIDPEYRADARGNYYPQTRFYAIGLSASF